VVASSTAGGEDDEPLQCEEYSVILHEGHVTVLYWTNSGNRSWTVTVDNKNFICNVSITTLAIIFRHS